MSNVWKLEQLRIYTTRDSWKLFEITLAQRLMQFWDNFQISLAFIQLPILAGRTSLEDIHNWLRYKWNSQFSSYINDFISYSLVSLENESRTTKTFSGFNKTTTIITIAKESKQKETNIRSTLVNQVLSSFTSVIQLFIVWLDLLYLDLSYNCHFALNVTT